MGEETSPPPERAYGGEKFARKVKNSGDNRNKIWETYCHFATVYIILEGMIANGVGIVLISAENPTTHPKPEFIGVGKHQQTAGHVQRL